MWCAYTLSLYHSTALSHYKTLHTLSPKKAPRHSFHFAGRFLPTRALSRLRDDGTTERRDYRTPRQPRSAHLAGLPSLCGSPRAHPPPKHLALPPCGSLSHFAGRCLPTHALSRLRDDGITRQQDSRTPQTYATPHIAGLLPHAAPQKKHLTSPHVAGHHHVPPQKKHLTSPHIAGRLTF